MNRLIVAIDHAGGIGLKNRIPWKNGTDLLNFQRLTTGAGKNRVIMGSHTFFSLPDSSRPLPKRHNVVVSRNSKIEELAKSSCGTDLYSEEIDIEGCSDYDQLLDTYDSSYDDSWIIGGSEIYRQALKKRRVEEVHLTVVPGSHGCDSFFPVHWLHHWQVAEKKLVTEGSDYGTEFYRLLHRRPSHQDRLENQLPMLQEGEYAYLCEMNELLMDRSLRRVETRNGPVVRHFDRSMTFDLAKGFPLLTTKKMFWRGVVEELLMFMNGRTDSKILEEKGVGIWKGNTTREFLDSRGLIEYKVGDMGPMYGWQWRHFGADYRGCDADYRGQGFDQLRSVIEKLRDDPHSRRILLTSYNPDQVSEAVLPPCHSLPIQFGVENGYLHCKMYQRSADIFLGVPFNIASTALLIHILATVTNLRPGKMTLTFGDLHLYEAHFEAADEQFRRQPLARPTLTLPYPEGRSEVGPHQTFRPTIETIMEYIENLSYDDVELTGYDPAPAIKAPMIA